MSLQKIAKIRVWITWKIAKDKELPAALIMRRSANAGFWLRSLTCWRKTWTFRKTISVFRVLQHYTNECLYKPIRIKDLNTGISWMWIPILPSDVIRSKSFQEKNMAWCIDIFFAFCFVETSWESTFGYLWFGSILHQWSNFQREISHENKIFFTNSICIKQGFHGTWLWLIGLFVFNQQKQWVPFLRN